MSIFRKGSVSSETPQPTKFLYEMHQHTSGCSGCAHDDPVSVVRQLKKEGFAGMVLTNHFYAGGKFMKTEDPVKTYLDDYYRAAELGEKEENITHAIEAIVEPVSLYEPVYNDGGDSIYIMDQISDAGASDEAWLENIALKEAMKRLNEREKKIIHLRFFNGKTQMEIADEIGISQAQVSRLEKGAIGAMRKSVSVS